MDAVAADGPWDLRFPDPSHPGYDEVWEGDLAHTLGRLGLPEIPPRRVGARDLWRAICEGAASTGNPGLVFPRRPARTRGPRPHTSTGSSRPTRVGSSSLPEDGACNLGAVNLVAHWNPHTGQIDREELERRSPPPCACWIPVIDASPPIDHGISRAQAVARRVGVGTMGLADALILSGIRYGSPSRSSG